MRGLSRARELGKITSNRRGREGDYVEGDGGGDGGGRGGEGDYIRMMEV